MPNGQPLTEVSVESGRYRSARYRSARFRTGEGEELLAGAGILARCPQQGGGDGPGTDRAHPAHRHAGVFRLDGHADCLGARLIVRPVGDPLGQPLLDLRAAGEMLEDPTQLGQPRMRSPGGSRWAMPTNGGR